MCVGVCVCWCVCVLVVQEMTVAQSVNSLLQQLLHCPMEMMSVLRWQQVTRVPSIPILHHLLSVHSDRLSLSGQRSVFGDGVDPTAVSYVVNPAGDLKNSTMLLRESFERSVSVSPSVRRSCCLLSARSRVRCSNGVRGWLWWVWCTLS